MIARRKLMSCSCRLAWLALLVFSESCSSPAPAASNSMSSAGTGPSLKVPDISCPEAGTLVSADAGTCVVHTPRNFARDVAPLFNGCGGEICHEFAGGAIVDQVGVLADECCNQISIIEPGHPERSYLLDKLSGQHLCMGSQMPLYQPPLNPDDLQIISDWICQGASMSP
jgi:hypothetical protein